MNPIVQTLSNLDVNSRGGCLNAVRAAVPEANLHTSLSLCHSIKAIVTSHLNLCLLSCSKGQQGLTRRLEPAFFCLTFFHFLLHFLFCDLSRSRSLETLFWFRSLSMAVKFECANHDVSLNNFITYNIEAVKISSRCLWRHWYINSTTIKNQHTTKKIYWHIVVKTFADWLLHSL